MQETALDKIISRIAGLSTAKLALVAILVTAVYFYMLYDDGSQIEGTITALQTQLTSEEAKKLETTKILRKEEQMRADVALMAKKFEEVRSRIPIDFSETDMRVIVEGLVQKNGLRTIKNRRTEALPSLSTAPEAALVQQFFLEYTFLGNFNNVFRFAQEVSSLEKIIRISNFAIIPDRLNPDYKGQEISFNVILVGFRQAPPESSTSTGAGEK